MNFKNSDVIRATIDIREIPGDFECTTAIKFNDGSSLVNIYSANILFFEHKQLMEKVLGNKYYSIDDFDMIAILYGNLIAQDICDHKIQITMSCIIENDENGNVEYDTNQLCMNRNEQIVEKLKNRKLEDDDYFELPDAVFDSELVQQCHKEYIKLNGVVDYDIYTDYFNMFNRVMHDAIFGDLGPKNSLLHKMIYDHATHNDCGYKTSAMYYYAIWVGDEEEANRIFESIDKIIPCT